ncbi:helix-turn-helix domain-containing protein [Alphaproteobacteria bacterium]|nr:helix-turn-helix domain-containing protein [Alphaproteobacteria bacterium]
MKSAVLLTEKEVQEYYKINVNTLQRNRSVGLGLPYVKLGRLVRYKVSDIEKYLDANTVGGHRYD